MAISVVGFVVNEILSDLVKPWLDKALGYPVVTVTLAVLVLVFAAYLRQISPAKPVEPVEPAQPWELLELPPRVSGFVGRRAERTRVLAAARRRSAVAIVGERGVGTSALLSIVAHAVRGRYHDGQVYLDVRGSGQPLTVDQVLGRVCRKLGLAVPGCDRPSDLDAAATWLRTWLAGRRVLLVLDNVDDPKAVDPLLPQSGMSLVLLAGCPELADLAHGVPVGALSDADAVTLLTRGAPSQVTGGEQTSPRLAQLCGRLPLAIRLVRAQLQEPLWSVNPLLHALEAADASGYVDEPSTSEALRGLWSICDIACQNLARPSRRMFGLLALVPGAEVDVPTAAVLTGLDEGEAAEVLDTLARLEFVESSVRGHRYRLRNLLRPSARRCLNSDETPSERRKAVSRLAAHLSRLAGHQADTLLLARRQGEQHPATTRVQASAWFDREHDLLYRMVTDWLPAGRAARPDRLSGSVQRDVFDIAVALCRWYATESRLLADWRGVCNAVGETSLSRRDESVAAWVCNELAVVHRSYAAPAAASQELVRATKLLSYRHRFARAQLLTNQGLVQLDQRHVQEAVGTLERARRLRGDRYGKALTDVALSAAHLYGNNPGLARLHADRSLRKLTSGDNVFLTTDVGELKTVAAALNNLGLALWRQGDHIGAKEQWDKAYEVYDELDDSVGEARVHLNRAAMFLTQAPARVDEAIDELNKSIELRGAGPVTVGTGLCHLHLGYAYARKCQRDDACDEWHRAWKVFERLGLQPEADEARRLIGQHGCGDVPPPRPPRLPEPRPRPTGLLAGLGDLVGRALARFRR